jgi:tetratricopeptide (TPR) repeat protein
MLVAAAAVLLVTTTLAEATAPRADRVAGIAAQGKPDFGAIYREAIADLAKADFKSAETKLLNAIKIGPPAGRGAIRRGIFDRDDYFPQFYLGIVYLNTGRAADALVQFQIARKQNINLRDREFQRLPEYEAKAKELADADAAKRAAPDPKQQFKALIDQAQRALGESRYDDADNAARQARALNVDNDAVASILQNVSRARATARLQEALKGTPSLADLRRLLSEYGDSGVSLDEVRRRIAAGEAVERRNAAERAAMVAFYEGKYPQALTALTEAEKATTLSARGQFYRAVTLASQATRGKVVNQTLLREARRAWTAASERPSEFEADLRYISPQILQLLRGR